MPGMDMMQGMMMMPGMPGMMAPFGMPGGVAGVACVAPWQNAASQSGGCVALACACSATRGEHGGGCSTMQGSLHVIPKRW